MGSGAWGDNFLFTFFEHTQRNHKMALDKVKKKRYEYIFCTTMRDYQKYKDKFIVPNITFIIMKEPLHLGGMNRYQLEYAYKRERPLIFISSDNLYSTNILDNLANKFYDKIAVCIMSQRMYPEILQGIYAKENYEDAFSPREFLRICLPHIHQRERRYFMDSYRVTGSYGSLMWPVRDNNVLVGILIRSFHLGIAYSKRPVPGYGGGWLDSDPFLNKLANAEEIFMNTDSDNGFCVGLELYDKTDNGKDDAPILSDMSQITRCRLGWLGGPVTSVNESLMGFNIAVHSESLDQKWIDLAKEADNFITNIYNGNIKNKQLMWEMLP